MTEYTPHQKSLIEKHRDINTHHYDWWDCTYGDFEFDMSLTGIEVDKMMFSGFWSQGDGASFTGRISGTKLFMEHHKLTETYPTVMRLLSHGGHCDLRVERTSSRYCHEYTVTVHCTHNDHFRHILDDSAPLRVAVAERWDEDLDSEIAALENTVAGIIRDDCRSLYRKLEEEYNYQTSDDAVWEAIQNNDLATEEEDE
jgi:hypothetical protein